MVKGKGFPHQRWSDSSGTGTGAFYLIPIETSLKALEAFIQLPNQVLGTVREKDEVKSRQTQVSSGQDTCKM